MLVVVCQAFLLKNIHKIIIKTKILTKQ